MQEYVRERGEGSLRSLEQARGECRDRERWKLLCLGHPLVGAPRSRRRNELTLLLLLLLNMTEKAEWDEHKCYKLPDDNPHPP